MRRVGIAILFLIGVTIYPISVLNAANIENCRIKASDSQIVSLGFPIKTERLAGMSKPKLLVIPIKLKDNPNYTITEIKKNYEITSSNIVSLSMGKSSPEFIVLEPIITDFTTETLDTLKDNQNIGNQKQDESISTWGFVRKFIADHDSTIDFTDIKGVILETSSINRNREIAEAMMMSSGSSKGYFRPIETGEGKIFNTALLYNNSNSSVITHEVMHLYGLTDLYGSNKGPESLSLMATNEIRLLNYEKWVLGWHPDQYVTCISGNDSQKINKFELDIREQEQIALVRPNQDSLYVIETSRVKENYVLSFYKLINDDRPPITFYSYSDFRPGVKLGEYKYPNFANSHQGDQHSLLIHSMTDSVVTVYTYPNSAASSPEVQRLLIEARVIQEAKVKETADLRIKQEAEAAAELKAKQEADAKAVAEKLATEKLAAAKLASLKKTTITCVKGKLTKKVTAVKPKCPTGYKLKK